MSTEYYWIAGVIVIGALIYKLSKNERPDSLNNESSNVGFEQVDDAIEVDGKVDNEVLQHIKDGRMIEAIKQYRTVNKCGLKDAKEAVDRIKASLK